ncbi:MAG: MFS transporter [Planctomycetota bacterium]|nr:MFS transporter [Planctomycetota bacterium]
MSNSPVITPVAQPAEDRLGAVQFVAYACGMLVNNLQAAALPAMMVVLNLGLGLDPVWVGVIGFVPRIFDAVSDPLMGFLSDNTRTRWGRRRPYIFAGAVVSGLVFIGMWQMPLGYSKDFYFWFFLVALVTYFLTYTIYATPFVAFGYEMTSDYHQRTWLHAFANSVGQLAWIFTPWIWAIMYQFENKVQGASILGICFGSAIILLGMIPAIFCRERVAIDQQRSSTELSDMYKVMVEFFQNVFKTLTCHPFVKLCLSTFLVFNGYQLGVSFSLYVMIYYIYGGQDGPAGELNGWWGSLTAICTIVVIPATALISRFIGKKKTFLVTISLSIVGYALKWIGYNPDYPYLLLISCPLVAFGTGSLFTLMGSMISDVCDYDELQTGQRREGVFGAIYWWMVKVGMALALLLTGYLLNYAEFITPEPDATEPVVQSVKTLLFLRIYDVVIPIATSLLALGIMSTYEISETRANEIRDELENRRGKLS